MVNYAPGSPEYRREFFHRQMNELSDFLKLADTVLEKIAATEESKVISAARKFF